MSETTVKEKKTKKEVTVQTVVGDVEQIVIPHSMTKLEASQQLKKQWEEEETSIDLIHEFKKWDPQDALVAIMKTMKKTLGWIPGVPIKTWFGAIPPAEVEVVVGVENGREIHELCFMNRFCVEQWDKANCDVGINRNAGTAYISMHIKKKFTARARRFFEEVQETLIKDSIYRGKSLMVDGKDLDEGAPFFHFIENKGSSDIVLNPDEEMVVTNLVINPLGKYSKRCILFTGGYGTGKTETAMRIGREANKRGITYIYCKNADLFTEVLEKAKQYQPALVFLEDIDEIGSGEERDSDMNDILNTLDGAQTKGNNITVIFTTNHERRINKALRRPGRIDVIVRFKKLEPGTQKLVYQKLLANIPGGDALSYDKIVEATPPCQGAVIAEICKRSKNIADFSLDEKITDDIVLSSIVSMKDQLEFMEEDPEEVKDPAAEFLNYLVDRIKE